MKLELNEALLPQELNTYEKGWETVRGWLELYEHDKDELDSQCQRLYDKYTTFPAQNPMCRFAAGALAVIDYIDRHEGSIPE